MFQPHTQHSAAKLRNEISRAPAAASELVSAALDLMVARRAAPYRADWTRRVHALIEAQAWTDAVLAIAELDRSRAIHYVVYEDGEWHCRIGAQWAVPHWLGDSAEFCHPVLALAILGALVDTLGWAPETNLSPAPAPRWPAGETGSISAVSCDNYL
jgi:hypothetical protein